MKKIKPEFKKFTGQGYEMSIDDTGLISLTFSEDLYQGEETRKIMEATQCVLIDIINLIENNPFDEYQVLCDYTFIKLNTFPLKSRKAYMELIASENISKIATLNTNPSPKSRAIVMIFSAMDVILKNCQIKNFNNKKEALKWIRK